MRLHPDARTKRLFLIEDVALVLRDLPVSHFDAASRRQWIPVLPVGTLAALPAAGGGRSEFEVTRETLDAACSELARYYADLDARGSTYRRPIIAEHNVTDYQMDADGQNARVQKDGRRSGSILDAQVRPFDAVTLTADGPGSKSTLFLLGEWNENAWAAIAANELEHISVHILAEYVDPETGNTYSPFIYELSETVIPVVKDFSLKQTLDPTVPERLGLRLADEPEDDSMDEAQVAALIAAALEPIAAAVMANTEALAALAAADPDAEPEGDPAPLNEEPVAVGGAPAEPATPAPVAPAVSLSDVMAELASMKASNAEMKRRLKAGRFSEPGAPTVAPKGPVPSLVLSEADALAQAERELPDAGHLAQIKRAQQLRGN